MDRARHLAGRGLDRDDEPAVALRGAFHPSNYTRGGRRRGQAAKIFFDFAFAGPRPPGRRASGSRIATGDAA
jgi:hypothetical protein